ncbi:hypothetical protein Ahy_A03g014726 isoform B [Arachis hypogaea]|uniref:AAA+ ATPase domain-containing protein n=1 Tax=Arachis hypogaea TaxID=3818 RepID=A0A445DYN0_ARAHY|nr:hypothetical protein Ahy_A03g014726 isoform A [Arachis hypogaea]RYR68247.1 hypothetical protein Ahy_A03g014726 isoform B [Arachis hypogaea]
MDTIASIASNVAVPVLKQLTYVLLYNTYVTNLENEVQKLQREEKEVRHTVEAAKRNGEQVEDTVRDWFTRVRAAIEEAQEFLRHEEQERVGCLDIYSKYTFSQKARNLVDHLSELRQETFDKVSYRCALKCNVSSASRGYEALESRSAMLNEIMQALKDSEVSMIGVYGMGGVGKTALVKELAWQAEKGGSFDVVVEATVTSEPDVRTIRAEIADGLGLKFDELTEMGKACRLRQRIRQEQSILVILDDVWGKLDLTEVGVPSGEDHKGCKLLVTSRDLNVLNAMLGAQKVFRLEVLSESESWNLFEKKGGEAAKDDSIQRIAKKVAENCAGLPLLIVTVVEALKNKDFYAWKDALEQLTNFDLDGCSYSKVHSAVEQSYEYLESHELQTFFLLLGSLGNYYSIKDLLVYGWCLGLHKNVDSLADGRNRLYKLIDNLRAASLLLEGERYQVEALHIVRIVAAAIASRTKPFFTMQRNTELKEWPRMDFLETCQHIFLDWCYINELPEKLECPTLKILQLCSQGNYLKLPENFFVEMRELKVLTLGGLNCTPSLPSSLGLLTNLQALNLCKCMLEDIAVVGELKNLEILSLEKSELIEELPAEIGQLIHLRFLDLTDCSTLRVIPHNLISKLTSLEELLIENCNIQWEVQGYKKQGNDSSLSELGSLHKLTTLNIHINDASVFPRDLLALGKLHSYNISIGNGWNSIGVESGFFKVSRVFKLNPSMDPRILVDYGIKMLMNRAEDLHLAELKGVREVLYELNDDGFSLLKHLSIQNSDDMRSIIGPIEWAHRDHAFPNLESLILHNLSNLERICSGPLPAQAFTKLRVVKIKGCDQIEFVFPHSMVEQLSELLEVEICECKFMTKIVAEKIKEDDSETDKIQFLKMRSLTLECLPSLVSLSPEPSVNNNTIQLFTEKVEFPNLENLKLCSINVHKIWDDKLSAQTSFQNLTTLTVDGCERLAYLFSYHVAARLVKLQHLLINSCKLVEHIFSQDGNTDNVRLARKSVPTEMGPIFPNLETIVISEMESLKSIWPSQLPQNSFSKLKKMEITYCSSILNVFQSHVLDKLLSLDSLDVWYCDALEFVYEIEGGINEVDIQLRALSLGHLPNLKHLMNKDPQECVRFENLSMVKVTTCKSLKHVFPLSMAKDLLQLGVLEISDCGVEEIIGNEHGGGEEQESPLGLVFPKLACIKLLNLPELRWFCNKNHYFRFPLLNQLYLVECPAMETFSHGILRASILRRIYLNEKGDQSHWEGDLNTTIRKIFTKVSLEVRIKCAKRRFKPKRFIDV